MQHLAEQLGLKVLPPLRPRYNIAPSQLVACVRTNPESQERECVELKWGLVPSWAKDPSIGNKIDQCPRGDGCARNPPSVKPSKSNAAWSWPMAFMNGNGKGKTKQPYYIRFKDHRLFAFAGLWERWEKQEPAFRNVRLDHDRSQCPDGTHP